MSRSVALALGSNVGDRLYWLRRATRELQRIVRLVRVSEVVETAAVDAPAGSGQFLNLVLVGTTDLSPLDLLAATRSVELCLGRRRAVRNAPRNIDIDIVMIGATVLRSKTITLPHPRFRDREFVLAPFRSLQLEWCDPVSGRSIRALHAPQEILSRRSLY